MHLVEWALVCWGVTLLVTTSKIFRRLRGRFPHAGPGEDVTRRTFLGSMLHCPMCFGTWAGMALAAFGWPPFRIDALGPIAWCAGLVAGGASGAAVAWFAHVLHAHLGRGLDL